MPFPTWDPATATSVTLSGGNLVATSAGGSTDHGAHVAAATGKTSGKNYFEVTVTTNTGGNDTCIGIGTTTSTYNGMGTGGGVTGVISYQGLGNIWANGSNTGSAIGIFLSGDVIGVAVDLDNRKIWFRKSPSGNWNGSGTANPATNIGGITVPAGTMVPFCVFNANGNVFTANFGATAFSGAVPSGFTSGWDDPVVVPPADPIPSYAGGVAGARRGRMIRRFSKPKREEEEEEEELSAPSPPMLIIGRQRY